MSDRLWVLGAFDPEMEAIREVLESGGERYVRATVGGIPVSPSQAYAVDPVEGATHWVESAPRGGRPAGAVVVDHHRPGDPGYGLSPDFYLEASSLGQVLALLNLEPTQEARLVAAADHCPGAAYRGHCPGVDPDDLMRFRAAQRAGFQKRSIADVLADVERTSEAIRSAPTIELGGVLVADIRPGTLPELPEASLRLGIPVLYQMIERDGRRKVGILGAGAGTAAGTAPVQEFLGGWGAAQGLTDLYGDPVRGFAGGYF